MNFGFIVLTEIEKNKKYSRSNFSLVYILEFTQKIYFRIYKKIYFRIYTKNSRFATFFDESHH